MDKLTFPRKVPWPIDPRRPAVVDNLIQDLKAKRRQKEEVGPVQRDG